MKIVQFQTNSPLFFFLCSLFIAINSSAFVQCAEESQDPKIPLISNGFLYLARLGVGQPARDFYFVVDTVSDFSWIQCLPCTRCYNQSDPIFDPRNSTSYRSLPCDSSRCSSLRGNDSSSPCGPSENCDYGTFYRDYSLSSGEFVTETLTFDGSHSVNNFTIGCSHNSNGSFGGATGVLGLSPGIISLPTQLEPTSFSYCFVQAGSNSSSTLEINSLPANDSVFVPMLQNPKIGPAYYVEITGIIVGGARLDIPATTFQVDAKGNGGVIIDSASPLTLLPANGYKILRDAFRNKTKDIKHVEVPGANDDQIQLFDTCYNLSSSLNLSDPFFKTTFPMVAFQFAGGKTLLLEPRNCLVQMDFSGRHFCIAFAPSSSSVSVLGNVLQQGSRVFFDLKNKQIGFSQNKC